MWQCHCLTGPSTCPVFAVGCYDPQGWRVFGFSPGCKSTRSAALGDTDIFSQNLCFFLQVLQFLPTLKQKFQTLWLCYLFKSTSEVSIPLQNHCCSLASVLPLVALQTDGWLTSKDQWSFVGEDHRDGKQQTFFIILGELTFSVVFKKIIISSSLLTVH